MVKIKNEKSCGTIVLNDNKILIVQQRKSGNLGFPKGHIIVGETEVETAIRETKEETNVDVEIIEEMRYSLSYITDENINKEVVYFVAKASNASQAQKQDEEIQNVYWIDIDKVEETLTYNNLREVWKKAYYEIKKTLV